MGERGVRASLATLFSRDHYESMRMQRRELSRDELDLVILVQIAALLAHTSNTIAPKPLPRQRSSDMQKDLPETAWNRYYSIIHQIHVHNCSP